MNTVEILVAARQLIEKPEHWTKGITEDINNKGESCWCVLGAIGEVGVRNNLGWLEQHTAMDAISAVMPEHLAIHLFNDDEHTTHAMVLELLDRAIEKAVA